MFTKSVTVSVARCVKEWSCFSSSLEWKSMDSINGIPCDLNQYLTLSNTSQMTFFSFRNTVHWRTLCANALSFWKKKMSSVMCAHCMQRSPTAAALSTSCSPTVPSWTHWLQDLGSHTAAWIWVASQKDWRNQGATGWILATHWYSIWIKQCDFRVSPFCQVLQKHTLFEVAH